MGLLSRRNKLGGLFGDEPVWNTMPGPISGYGGGTFNMDGTQATSPDYQANNTPPQPQVEGQPEEKKGGFLGRFFGGDFTDRAARAMAFMNDDYMGAAQISRQMRQQMMEKKNQEALNQALAGMNLTPEQKALFGSNPELAGRAVMDQFKRQNEGPDYGYTQDNAGNMWQYDKRTGQFADRPNFVDPNERIYMQDGQMVRVPNQFQREPTAPVGKLTPIAPTIQNTPPPKLGANGLPATLTRQQYEATVAELGKAKTDEWMHRNNIQIGGF